MRLGLLLGQLAARDELADQRVVAREPDQVAVAQQVAARVADVGDDDRVLRHVRGGERRAHARRARLSARERSWMRAFAASMMLDERARAGRRRAGRPRTSATAISDATSPACAPPIPSATTNSGARTK